MRSETCRIAFICLSALVGAGFATGREICTYFISCGFFGIAGLVISCLLLLFCFWKILISSTQYGVDNPYDYSTICLGKVPGSFISLAAGIFSYIMYVILLSGLNDLTGQILPPLLVKIPVAASSVYVLFGGFEMLEKIISYLTPGIILMVISFSVYAIFSLNRGFIQMEAPQIELILKNILLYTGYNVLIALTVLPRMGNRIMQRDNCIKGSVLGVGIFFLCGAVMFFALLPFAGKMSSFSMPLLEALRSLGFTGALCFTILLSVTVILSAVFGLSGACASLFSRFKRKERVKIYGLIMAGAAIPLSEIPFDVLMDRMYPVFGCVGIFFILLLVFCRGRVV